MSLDNVVLIQTEAVTGLRFHCNPLEPGESLSSGIDRAASLWGVSRVHVVKMLGHHSSVRRNRDLDAGDPDRVCTTYPAATGMSPSRLQEYLARRPEVLVGTHQRYAYCPLCFCEDRLQGKVPFFRLDWARVFLTHCHKHKCPLFPWRTVRYDGSRKLPHAWFFKIGEKEWREGIWFDRDLEKAEKYETGELPRSRESRVAWNALVAFETDLFESIIGDPVSRPPLEGDPLREGRLKNRLVELIQPREGKVENCLAAMVRPAFEDHEILAFTLRAYRYRVATLSWNTLRNVLGHLACRRAALLLASGFLTTREVPECVGVG
jgi:hypothetical protein